MSEDSTKAGQAAVWLDEFSKDIVQPRADGSALSISDDGDVHWSLRTLYGQYVLEEPVYDPDLADVEGVIALTVAITLKPRAEVAARLQQRALIGYYDP